MRTTALLASLAFFFVACGGQDNPLASTPREKPLQADEDTTAATCGTRIVIQGGQVSIHGVESVETSGAVQTVPDDTLGGGEPLSVSASGIHFIDFRIGTKRSTIDATWIEARGGWAYYDSLITDESVLGVYMRLYNLSGSDGEWPAFDDYAGANFPAGSRPTATVNGASNELFITDSEGLLEFKIEGTQWTSYEVALLIQE